MIRSNEGRDLLQLSVVRPGDRWRARLDFVDLVAEAKVCERHSGTALELDRYFASLAKRWRGWRGTREWESLGMSLAARHDGLGHVTLDVTLDQDYAAAERWTVRASLFLDAGALDHLSNAARVLDPGDRFAGPAGT